MNIELRTCVGENAVTHEAGQAVYTTLRPILQRGEEVHLDFSGVKVLASPFLNAAIGQLLKELSSQNLNRLLKVEHMTPAGRSTLRVVIATTKDHYANNGARARASTMPS